MTYKKQIINNKILKRIVFLCFAVAILLTSCVTPRRVNYLQDMTQGSQIELENRFEATIAPYDELNITVTSPNNPELAIPFSQSASGQDRFLVDVNGNIDMPVLGTMHVAGLTRLRLQDTLIDLLRTEGIINEPYVNVRFNNFKIFYLGNG